MWWTAKAARATVVGDIYLIGSLSITPAAIIGGLLDAHPANPIPHGQCDQDPGDGIFMLTVDEPYAG